MQFCFRRPKFEELWGVHIGVRLPDGEDAEKHECDAPNRWDLRRHWGKDVKKRMARPNPTTAAATTP